MEVWLLSADYFFSSQLQGDVQKLGLQMQQVNNGASLVEKVAASENESVVVIDLTLPELNFDVVSQLRSSPKPPKAVIAFGPHVAEGKLQAANNAGCDQVLTRGQAHRELGAVLQSYVGA